MYTDVHTYETYTHEADVAAMTHRCQSRDDNRAGLCVCVCVCVRARGCVSLCVWSVCVVA